MNLFLGLSLFNGIPRFLMKDAGISFTIYFGNSLCSNAIPKPMATCLQFQTMATNTVVPAISCQHNNEFVVVLTAPKLPGYWWFESFWKMMEFVNGKDDIPCMKWKINLMLKPPTSTPFISLPSIYINIHHIVPLINWSITIKSQWWYTYHIIHPLIYINHQTTLFLIPLRFHRHSCRCRKVPQKLEIRGQTIPPWNR